MTDYATTFRVLVIAQGKRGESWLADIESHGWTAVVAWGQDVGDEASALLPHAAVIDPSDLGEAARAALAVRRFGLYNAVLLFVTAEESVQERVRALVPVPTFVTEREFIPALWDLPAARAH